MEVGSRRREAVASVGHNGWSGRFARCYFVGLGTEVSSETSTYSRCRLP